MRGKRHHHGGHICGIVVLGFTVLFVLFHPTGWEFLFPPEPIAVKLLMLVKLMVDSVVGGTFFVDLSSPAKMLEMSPGEWWQYEGPACQAFKMTTVPKVPRPSWVPPAYGWNSITRCDECRNVKEDTQPHRDGGLNNKPSML